MLVCLDVDYRKDGAVAALVGFRTWLDKKPCVERIARIPANEIAPYEPGAFYKRELPCLLKLMDIVMPYVPSFMTVSERVEAVVIDGYVWLSKDEEPGLGSRLYDALKQRQPPPAFIDDRGYPPPVIGVGKRPFKGAEWATKILRGTSKVPLYVTAVGMERGKAAETIRKMHGTYRIPTLLGMADRLCRSS